MFEWLAEFYKAGGPWMHPISLWGSISLAICIERVITLFFRLNMDANQFMAQIQKLVIANNIDRAIKLCSAAPKAALPRVVKAALVCANRGEAAVAAALEEASVEVMRDITVRIPILPNLSNMATLSGLLGTIIGLIEAFAAVAQAPPDMKSQLLTQSLAIGLNATAFGLIVAIPTLAVYIFLATVSKKLIDDIDQYSLKLQNLLVARGGGHGGMQQPPAPGQ